MKNDSDRFHSRASLNLNCLSIVPRSIQKKRKQETERKGEKGNHSHFRIKFDIQVRV